MTQSQLYHKVLSLSKKLFPVEKTSHLMLSKQQHMTAESPASLLTCHRPTVLCIRVSVFVSTRHLRATHCGSLR
jgi:hypothetical protein